MPYKSFWMPEHAMILSDVRGTFTLSELKNMMEENITYMKQTDHFVHIIIDTRRLERIQFKIHEFSDMGLPSILPNTGWNIILSDNPIFVFTASIIVQLLKNVRFRNLTTMEATVDFMASVEPLAQTLTLEKVNALVDSWESS
ncbi:MAG: hypothetical protein ACOYLB_01495 [Phototrophicaceae bacterium]